MHPKRSKVRPLLVALSLFISPRIAPRYRDHDWGAIESEAERGCAEHGRGTWEEFKDAVRSARTVCVVRVHQSTRLGTELKPSIYNRGNLVRRKSNERKSRRD
jgi:hypothetical protein